MECYVFFYIVLSRIKRYSCPAFVCLKERKNQHIFFLKIANFIKTKKKNKYVVLYVLCEAAHIPFTWCVLLIVLMSCFMKYSNNEIF